MAQQTQVTDGQGNEIFVYENKNTGRNRRALTVDPAGHILTHTALYSVNQTNIAMITPTSGTLLCVRDIFISCSGNTGTIEINFNTSNIAVARLYATRDQRIENINCHIEGAIDEPLSITSTTGANEIFILVNYIEET